MKRLRIPLLVLIVIFSAFLLKGRLSHKSFDSDLWKTAKLNAEEAWFLRWDMMNDLRNEYKLIGMTKKEIIDLLGDPGSESRREFVYGLGYTKTGINTGSLTIEFNKEDIVSGFRVSEG